MNLLNRTILAAAAAALAAGCSGFGAYRQSEERIADFKANEMAAMKAQLAKQREAAATSLVEEISAPFIGATQIAAPKTTQWPSSLTREARVTMNFADNRPDSTGNVVVPIADFAQQVSMATGVSVRVKPEALTDAAGKPVFVTMRPDFQGYLPDLFDQITARHRVFAAYKDGALEFFRTTTRTFRMATPLGETDMKFDTNSGGGEGGFTAQAGTKTTHTFKPAAAMEKAVLQFLSKGVVPVYNDQTGTLTITDTPDALDAVAAFIERENKLLTKNILFDVKVVRFSQRDNAASGVNWNLLYERIKRTSGAALQLATPTVAINPNDGSISLFAVPGTEGASRFDQSGLIFNALNEVGNAMVMRETTLWTTNRTPVVQAFNKQFDYVNETTASTTLAGVALGQKTRTENEGRTIMLVPALYSETGATVDVSIRESVKNPFTTNTIGEGASQQTVQLLDKDTEALRQRIPLKSGETRILTGIGGLTSEGNNRTYDKSLSALFGGSVGGAQRNEQFFLMITMRIVN